MKRGKKYLEKSKLVDKANLYDLDAACALIPQVSTAKFDETVEAHIRLGVDSRHADQQVRGAVDFFRDNFFALVGMYGYGSTLLRGKRY